MTDMQDTFLQQSYELQKYIGVHLQNFSLWEFLEPGGENEDIEARGSNASEQERSVSSLSSISLEFEDHDVNAAGLSRLQRQESKSVVNDLPEPVYEVNWDSMGILATNVIQEDDPNLMTFIDRFKHLSASAMGVPNGGHCRPGSNQVMVTESIE
jgi:hypothetical protein